MATTSKTVVNPQRVEELVKIAKQKGEAAKEAFVKTHGLSPLLHHSYPRQAPIVNELYEADAEAIRFCKNSVELTAYREAFVSIYMGE